MLADDGLGGLGAAEFTLTYAGGTNSSPQVRTSAGTSLMVSSADENGPTTKLYTSSFGALSPFVVNQGGVKAITNDVLKEADPDDDGTGVTFTVTTLPTKGQLWLDADGSGTVNNTEAALALNGTFTQADIDAGRLKYRHTAGNTNADSFTFSVSDDGEDGALAVTGVVFTIGVAPVSQTAGAPVLQAVTRSNGAAQLTRDDSVVFRVSFSDDVSGVDSADFVLTGSAASSGMIQSVSAVNGSTFDVTVGGAGLAAANGSLGLALANAPSITKSGTSTALDATVLPGLSETYTLDNAAPTATATASVSRHNGSTPFTVTFAFSEAIDGLDLDDFTVNGATLSALTQLSTGTDPPSQSAQPIQRSRSIATRSPSPQRPTRPSV